MRARKLLESRALPLLLFLAGLGLRLWHVSSLAALPSFDHPYEGLDAELYVRLARAVAGGDLLPSGLLDAAPLYAYWLALFVRAFGDPFLAPRLAQAVLGAAVAPLLFAAGRRSGGRAVGLLAGLAAAIFPPFLLYEGTLQSAALVPFLASLFLALAPGGGRGAAPGTGRRSFLAGLVLGLSVLNRPDLLPLLVLVPLLGFARGRRNALLLFAASLLPVVPFAAAASLGAGGFVPLTAHGGIHFYIGSHEGADGTLSPVPEIRPTPEGFAQDASAYARREAGRPLGPAETSRFYYGKGLDWIASHPKDFLVLVGKKAVLFWNDYEVPNNEDLYFLRRFSVPLRTPIPLFGIAAAFALYSLGAPLLLGARRPAGAAGPLALPALLVLASFAAALLFFVTGRYRLPAAAPLLLLGATGAAPWAHALLERQRAALLLLPLLAFTNLPVRRFDAAAAETRLASSYFRAGDLASAEEGFRRAEQIRPGFPEARRGLARVLAASGRADEALRIYREQAGRAMDGRPAAETRRARSDLAAALAESGRLEEAAALLDTLLASDPDDANALANLGAVRMRQGDEERAGALLERAIGRDPGQSEALLNLALLRTRQGRLDEAIRLFDRHLDLDGSSERGLYNAGVARAMAGDYEGAIRMWERLERIRPSYPNLESNLGRARAARAGRMDRAR